MRRFRIWILAGSLGAILWTLGMVQRSFHERAARLRSQPLVTLLEGHVQGPSRRLTSPMVDAADAALVPQVRVLLRRPVPVNTWGRTYVEYEGQQEFTPLMMAAKGRLPRCALELIEAGARLDTVDRDGRTALIWAVKNGNNNVVRILLAAGANPDLVDSRGRTAIDYAEAYSLGWDNQQSLLRSLKRVKAKHGPYALAKRSPYQRFFSTYSRHGQFSSEGSGNGIVFHTEARFEFPVEAPAVVTRKRFHRLRSGMSYPEVAVVLGREEVGGEMLPDYEGGVRYVQGRHRIDLRFRDGRTVARFWDGWPW